jgi:hypothetical protein
MIWSIENRFMIYRYVPQRDSVVDLRTWIHIVVNNTHKDIQYLLITLYITVNFITVY